MPFNCEFPTLCAYFLLFLRPKFRFCRCKIQQPRDVRVLSFAIERSRSDTAVSVSTCNYGLFSGSVESWKWWSNMAIYHSFDSPALQVDYKNVDAISTVLHPEIWSLLFRRNAVRCLGHFFVKMSVMKLLAVGRCNFSEMQNQSKLLGSPIIFC